MPTSISLYCHHDQNGETESQSTLRLESLEFFFDHLHPGSPEPCTQGYSVTLNKLRVHLGFKSSSAFSSCVVLAPDLPFPSPPLELKMLLTSYDFRGIHHITIWDGEK